MIQSQQDERVIIEYDDTTRAWNDWKSGNIIQKSSVHEQYILSLVECAKMYTTYNNLKENSDQIISSEMFDIPYLVKISPEKNRNCHICQKYHGQLYSCRICEKVYHQQCIKDIGEIKSYDLIKNAINLIGWSCPICEDLRIFLSSNELSETNEWIKSLGTQAIYDLDSYINIRIKSKSHIQFSELTDHMKIILENFLNTIPNITSNRLLQSDLFILDICLKILCISSKYLVKFLTQFELYRLSQLFLSLSSIDNQCITYKKFNQIFQRYLQITMPELNFNEQQSHLEALAYTYLGTTSIKFDRTWNQFILDVTIPTIIGRLNHRTTVDFINRIGVSIKQSKSPSTAYYYHHRNDQSPSILIKNVVQKLRQNENESRSLKKKKKRINKDI